MSDQKQHQQKEKFQGVWAKTGEQVTFNREWGGHRFTDQECQDLLAGKEVALTPVSVKTGKPYDVYGALAEQTYEGRDFVGFEKIAFGKKGPNGKPLPPAQWGGHEFTAEELETLVGGGKVYADDFKSRKSGSTYDTTVRFGESDGDYKIIPAFSDEF